MKLLRFTAPTDNCMIFSAAMLLDVEPKVLVEEIGHDGNEVWWPPNFRRGFHIQEIIDCFAARNFALYPAQVYAWSCPAEKNPDKDAKFVFDDIVRVYEHLKGMKALLIGRSPTGIGHMVAFENGMCYDPKGAIYPVEQFQLEEAWIMTKRGL